MVKLIGVGIPAPRKVAVLYIHGVANDAPGFSNDLHERIVEEVSFLTPTYSPSLEDDFIAREVCWYDVFKASREALTESIKHRGLSWNGLRKFTAGAIAQATGYEDTKGEGSYEAVNTLVANALTNLSVDAGPNAPLVIVAHSLGSVIASNIIWDRQHNTSGLVTPLERLDTLKLVVTMGSPLALYASRWPDMGVPFAARSKNIDWVNIIAPADLLAWPLSNLNSAYSREVTEDAVLSVGGLLGWTPAAHTRYWKSQNVADKISEYVKPVWDGMKRGRMR